MDLSRSRIRWPVFLAAGVASLPLLLLPCGEGGAEWGWSALADSGAEASWSHGCLWPMARALAHRLPVPGSGASKLLCLDLLLFPLLAGAVALLLLDTMRLAVGRAGSADATSPGAAGRWLFAASVVGALCVAATPPARTAAHSCGPWMLGFVAGVWAYGALLRQYHGTGGARGAPVAAFAAGMALSAGGWALPLLLAGAIPLFGRWLARGSSEAGPSVGPLPLACLAIGAGVPLLAAGLPQSHAIPSAAEAVVALRAWNIGVEAAPLAAREAGWMMLRAVPAAGALALVAVCVLSLEWLGEALDRPSERAWRASLTLPGLALGFGWAPAWSATGAERAMALLPCLVGLTQVAAVGGVLLGARPRAGRAVAWAAAVLAVVATVGGAWHGALTPGPGRGEPLRAATALDWAARLVAEAPPGVPIVLDDDLAPRWWLGGALLRAGGARGPLVVSGDPVSEREWPAVQRAIPLPLAPSSADLRWIELLTSEPPPLVSSWRACLAAGTKPAISAGLLTPDGPPDRPLELAELAGLAASLSPRASAPPAEALRARIQSDDGDTDGARAILEAALRHEPLSRMLWLEAATTGGRGEPALRMARSLDRKLAGMRGWEDPASARGGVLGGVARLLGGLRRLLG